MAISWHHNLLYSMTLCFCCVPFLFQKKNSFFFFHYLDKDADLTWPSLKWRTNPPTYLYISIIYPHIPPPTSHSRTWPYSPISTFISIFASYLKCLHAVPVVFPVLLYFTFLVYYQDMHLLVTGFPSFFLKKKIAFFRVVLLYIFFFFIQYIHSCFHTYINIPFFYMALIPRDLICSIDFFIYYICMNHSHFMSICYRHFLFFSFVLLVFSFKRTFFFSLHHIKHIKSTPIPPPPSPFAI